MWRSYAYVYVCLRSYRQLLPRVTDRAHSLLIPLATSGLTVEIRGANPIFVYFVLSSDSKSPVFVDSVSRNLFVGGNEFRTTAMWGSSAQVPRSSLSIIIVLTRVQDYPRGGRFS